MPRPKIDEILGHIYGLQLQLEQEFEKLLLEKRAQFKYTLEKGRVVFDRGVREFHRRYRTGLWVYLRNARLAHLLTAPVVYSVVLPLLFLDLAIFLYQQICFRAYGVPLVRCPIKHARHPPNPHDRVDNFADYGDAAVYQEKRKQLREALRRG